MVEILSFIQYSCPKACEVCYKNRFDISHVTLISDCNYISTIQFYKGFRFTSKVRTILYGSYFRGKSACTVYH